MIWNLFKITGLMSAIRTLQTLDTMTKGVLVFGIIVFVQVPWTSPISPATLKAYGVDHNKKGKQTNYQGCGQVLKRHVAWVKKKKVAQADLIIWLMGRWEKRAKGHKDHYLIRASMVLVNFFGNNIDDVPGGFEIFTWKRHFWNFFVKFIITHVG